MPGLVFAVGIAFVRVDEKIVIEVLSVPPLIGDVSNTN
jgi:hypothetical protein